jgi:hypothetical protein
MKSFDPMNDGDDGDFEQQLLGLELRRPPAEWKALLLPKPVPPLLPKSLLIFCAACVVASICFRLATPETEIPGPTILPPPAEPATWELALATPIERSQ